MGVRKRITMDLEEGLLAAIDRAAAETKVSRNRFVAVSLEATLRTRDRARVDEAFGRIAGDPAYQAELRQIATELSGASDAAWRRMETAERRPAGERRRAAPGGRHAAR